MWSILKDVYLDSAALWGRWLLVHRFLPDFPLDYLSCCEACGCGFGSSDDGGGAVAFGGERALHPLALACLCLTVFQGHYGIEKPYSLN